MPVDIFFAGGGASRVSGKRCATLARPGWRARGSRAHWTHWSPVLDAGIAQHPSYRLLRQVMGADMRVEHAWRSWADREPRAHAPSPCAAGLPASPRPTKPVHTQVPSLTPTRPPLPFVLTFPVFFPAPCAGPEPSERNRRVAKRGEDTARCRTFKPPTSGTEPQLPEQRDRVCANSWRPCAMEGFSVT